MSPHHLTLTTGPAEDVLTRVLLVCRRRRAEILQASWTRGDLHRPGRIDLVLAEPADRVARYLDALVDVREVR